MTATAPLSRAHPWRLVLWGGIAALLLLPLIAMQFTREVAWNAADFAAAAVLLVGAGAAWEIAHRFLGTRGRLVLGAALIAVVLLVWAQGAVGIV